LLVGLLGSLPDGSTDGSFIGLLALPLVGGLPDGLLVGPLVGLLDGLADRRPAVSLAAGPKLWLANTTVSSHHLWGW